MAFKALSQYPATRLKAKFQTEQLRNLRKINEQANTVDPNAWKPEKWVVYHQKKPKAGHENPKFANRTSFNKKRWL